MTDRLLTTAEIHAKIAAKAYPDAKKIEINTVHNSCYVIFGERNKDMQPWFNLLETDSNGNPTQQAKASALDVLVWFAKDLTSRKNDHMPRQWVISKLIPVFWQKNPCAAIYEAAKEIVND